MAAESIYDQNYALSIDDVLQRAAEVLRSTTRKDVDELVKMKRLANELCEYYEREVPEHLAAKTVYDYYLADLNSSTKLTSIKHNEELINGFPAVKELYELIFSSERKILNRKVEEAYHAIRTGLHREVSPGLTADCVACAIYLVLSHHPKDKIIR